MTKEFLLLIAIYIAIGVLVGWIVIGHPRFRWELRRLNMEIARTSGEERKQWRAQRRRLWLSLLPFIKY